MSATQAQRLALEYPSDSSSHITSQDVIEHIEFLEREIQALREANRKLAARLVTAGLQTGKKTREA